MVFAETSRLDEVGTIKRLTNTCGFIKFKTKKCQLSPLIVKNTWLLTRRKRSIVESFQPIQIPSWAIGLCQERMSDKEALDSRLSGGTLIF